MLLVGATGLATAPTFAQTVDSANRRYAVLSIIGDKITLVGYRQPIGSNLDQNDKRVLAVSGSMLDNSTVLSVDDAVKRAQPRAVTTLLAARDPKIYALQDASFDSPGAAADSVDVVRKLAQQSQATRLILVAPYRSEARFALRETFIGVGKIAGLGIYVDRIARISVTETGAEGTGFIAPYAYFSVSLVDTQSMATIRRQLVTESRLIPTAEVQSATEPWDVLSNDKKVEVLQALVRQGVDRVMPALLAGA